VDQRQVLGLAINLDAWLRTGPEAPDLKEPPQGWHKLFKSFTVCGEGECIKTVFTIYVPGKARRGSIDLDEWENRGTAS